MITKNGQFLAMETIDVSNVKSRSLVMCDGEIPGATSIHVTVAQGDAFLLKADEKHYNIFILIEGNCFVNFSDKEMAFSERVTFVPAPEKDMTITAHTDVQLVQIVWDITSQDIELRAEYQTEFPVVEPYATSIQYVDPNKSEKTISRMMIPHKIIPRFAIGSVESYGYDLVRPHSHPMLDQFFFSFPENQMDVIINGEYIPMAGNEIMHIPLGADHGVEVRGNDHMHYMWIDFLPDNAEGLKRLDASHKPTGTVRDLEKEDKFRDIR